MTLRHALGQFRAKVISVDCILLLVYIYNSAGVCCHGIYIIVRDVTSSYVRCIREVQ